MVLLLLPLNRSRIIYYFGLYYLESKWAALWKNLSNHVLVCNLNWFITNVILFVAVLNKYLAVKHSFNFMQTQAVFMQKWSPNGRIILAKGKLATIHYDSAPRPQRSYFAHSNVGTLWIPLHTYFRASLFHDSLLMRKNSTNAHFSYRFGKNIHLKWILVRTSWINSH